MSEKERWANNKHAHLQNSLTKTTQKKTVHNPFLVNRQLKSLNRRKFSKCFLLMLEKMNFIW